MASVSGRDPADMLAIVARHWGWTLAFGIITVGAGVLVLIWPRETLIILAVIFGVQLILTGIGELVDAFADFGASKEPLWFVALMASLSIFVGIVLVKNIFVTLAVIAFMLGVYCAIYGIWEVFSALASRQAPDRWWSFLLGLVAILTGIALLVYPGLSLLYLATVLGIFLILSGIIRIVVALLLMRFRRAIS